MGLLSFVFIWLLDDEVIPSEYGYFMSNALDEKI